MPKKTLDIIPASGSMDTRSPVNLVPFGDWRFIKNCYVRSEKNLCRVPGYDKLLTKADYNNQDLHDQLQDKTGFASRMPVTMLYEAISTRKTTKLLAGTGRAIYALNNGTGNWKVISDQLGSAETRWRQPAQLLDTVIFSNSVDPVQYWQFDQGITETADQSVAEIPDLRDIIKISRAGVVIVWKDHVFLMNVTVEGTVKSSTIFWGNYQRGLDYVPGEGSTAGNRDLDTDETILGALPLSNRLLVYTNKAIWEGFAVGGEETFTFSKRYAPKNAERCLFYPNTLLSIGNEHVYLGVDGVYVYNLFQDKPQLVDWMHKASGWMFNDLRRDDCDIHVGGYNSERKEIQFSFAREDDDLPSETLVLNTEFKFSYYLDDGYSAMVNYTFKDPGLIMRDFLLARCICTEGEFGDNWGGFTKEGGYCTAQETPACPNPPQSIWTSNNQELEDGIVAEDWEQEEPDEDSLCAQLEGLTLADLCDAVLRLDECASGLRFVVASSEDYSLKELSNNYYRERVTGFTGCGTYSKLGYKSLLRTGPMNFRETKNAKLIDRLEVEAEPEFQSVPSKLGLRIGVHARAVDPNEEKCPIKWEDQEAKELACLSDVVAAKLASENVLPDQTFAWPLWNEGQYVYFELSVFNDAVTPVDTGGPVCISRISMDVGAEKRSYV